MKILMEAKHFSLHGPNKELHKWKLGQPCSLHSSSFDAILSPAAKYISQQFFQLDFLENNSRYFEKSD